MKLGRQDLKPSKAHPEKRSRYHYICGNHSRFGKYYCYNHYIRIEDIEQIVLDDIRSKARLVLEDEDKARTDFLKHKEQMSAAQYKSDSKALMQKTKRYEELERLTQSVYEDKVIGKIPEEICLKLLAKYTEEQNALKSEIDELENKLSVVTKNETDVDEFIRRLKHYTNVPELTRELCMELIEYITIGAKPGDKTGTREIHIYYKLLGNSKLFCGHCGSKYRRHRYEIKEKGTGKEIHVFTWVCINHKLNGKAACPMTQVREETIQQAFVAALNSLVDDKEGFMETVIANINVILQTDLSPVNIDKLKDQYANKQKDLQTLMTQSVTSHDAALVARYEALMAELEVLKGKIKEAEERRVTASMHRERSEELKAFLSDKRPFEKFDDMVFRKLVQKAIVKEDEVTFVFSDYLGRTVPIIK